MKTAFSVFAALAVGAFRLVAQGSWAEFTAHLTGAQALPTNTIQLTGEATILLSGNALDVRIGQLNPTLNGEAFVQTAAGESILQLPFATALYEAPIMPWTPGGVLYIGGVLLSDSQVADLEAGRLYAAIGSPSLTNGAIRGQIVPHPSAPSTWSLIEPFPTLIVGDSVTFSAGFQGYPGPKLQWEFSRDGNTWKDIAGAVSGRLTVSGVTPGDAGYYQLRASNSVGVATSGAARLAYIATPSQPFPKMLLIAPPPDFTGCVFYASTSVEAPVSKWVPIATNVATTNMITDLGTTNYPRRFFRVLLRP